MPGCEFLFYRDGDFDGDWLFGHAVVDYGVAGVGEGDGYGVWFVPEGVGESAVVVYAGIAFGVGGLKVGGLCRGRSLGCLRREFDEYRIDGFDMDEAGVVSVFDGYGLDRIDGRFMASAGSYRQYSEEDWKDEIFSVEHKKIMNLFEKHLHNSNKFTIFVV